MLDVLQRITSATSIFFMRGYMEVDPQYGLKIEQFSTHYMVKYYMSKKPLIETNPFLRNRKKYNSALITNVTSSSAIEGVRFIATKSAKKSSKKSQR